MAHYCINCPTCRRGCSPCGRCACPRPVVREFLVGEPLGNVLQPLGAMAFVPRLYTDDELAAFVADVPEAEPYDDPQRPETD